MTHVFRALTAEPWAIEPSWLPLLAALAQRNHVAPEVVAAREWQERDFQLMAGPAAQRLAGAHRAYVNEGVCVIPLTGPIFPRANMMTDMSGATSVTMLQNDHRLALESAEVGAILFLTDSPGGQVPGIANFAAAVAAGARKKPTVAQVTGSGCSGAYWIISACPEIYIDRTAMVGSIGVATAYPKQVGPDSDGFVDIEIVSSNAPNKRPDPQSEDGLTQIREMLDAIEAEFIADVAKGRGITPTKVKADFKQGGVAIGSAAVALGMANKVQSTEATLNALAKSIANQRRLASLKN